jgi:hypothetical protein
MESSMMRSLAALKSARLKTGQKKKNTQGNSEVNDRVLDM